MCGMRSKTCKHCQRRKGVFVRSDGTRYYGLCNVCYMNARIRILYKPSCPICGLIKPPERKECASCQRLQKIRPAMYERIVRASRLKDEVGVGPTWHEPGTEHKLAVLLARAEQGCDLWHDDDARTRWTNANG